MIPSRPRRSTSRRSSILKPPKARHPLQNVDFNSSSSESSPAPIKQKRRVSFAEKKHVKEFCDSLEQGTVWDNTYEENDLSNSKLPNVSKEDEKPLELVTNEYTVEASLNSTNLVEKCTISLNNTSDIVNMDVVNPFVTMTSTESLPSAICQKNNEKQDTYSLNGDIDMLQFKLPVRGTICYDNNSPTYCAQNKENINSLHFSKMRSDDDLMEMTGVGPFLHSPEESNVRVNERSIARKLFNSRDTTNSNLMSDRNALQKTDTCQNVSMEMTGVVGMHPQTCQEALTSNLLSDRTQYFQDTSMDITGEFDVIKTNDTEQKTSTKQQREEHRNVTQMCYTESEDNLQEDRDIRNISMEFTTVVSHCNRPLDLYKECIPQLREDYSSKSDRTQIFQNVSMEMTEAVHIHGKDNCANVKYPEESAMYDARKTCSIIKENSSQEVESESAALGNVSMEFTTAIRSIPYNIEENILKYTDVHTGDEATLPDWQEQQGKQSAEIRLHEPDNRTMVMQVPMEITEAVPIYRFGTNTHSPTQQVKDQKRRQTESSTETKHTLKNAFLSNDLTQEVCSDRRKILEGKNAISGDETKIFYNESVAFTEIVPPSCLPLPATSLLPKSKQSNCGRFNSNKLAADDDRAERTKIFHDEEVSITEAVPSSFFPVSKVDDVQLKTKFPPVYENDEQHSLREIEDSNSKRHHIISDKTIVQDLSMEITKAVSSLPALVSNVKSNAKFDALSTEECCHVEQSYSVVTSQEKSGKNAEKRQDADNVILTEKISGVSSTETILSVTNTGTSSNAINERPVTQCSIGTDKEYISQKDDCFTTKYNESFSMGCSKENYSTSVTFSGRHKNSSVESRTSLKYMQPLSQQTDITNYCNESAMMTSENDNLASQHEIHKSDNFQPDDGDSSEIAEWKLMKTFINDDIEELETIQPPSFVSSDDSTANSLVDALNDSEDNIAECQDNAVISKERIETHGNSKGMFLTAEESYKMPCEKNSHNVIEKRLDSEYSTDIDMDNLNKACKHIASNVDSSVTKNKLIENFNVSSVNADEKSLLDVRVEQDEATFTTNSDGLISEKRISSPDNTIKQDIGDGGNFVREDSIFIQDPFRSLIAKIKNQARRDDCIWDLYYENVEKKMLGISFISNSLLIVIYLADNDGDIATQVIKEVKIISRLADDADVLISVVHKILVEKLNGIKLTQLFGNCEEVLPMLDHISQEVKLTMDFMFDLKRLDDQCQMELSRDRISFVLHTNKMDIVVIVSLNVKPLSDIKPDDITVSCLLGHVKDDDIKKLITNIKKDSKFLRRYMNDVRDYIELMEESIV